MIPCFNCNPAGVAGNGDPGCAYCSGRGTMMTDPETARDVNAAIAATRMRQPVAIALSSDGDLVALASDGTLWRFDNRAGWIDLPALPQP